MKTLVVGMALVVLLAPAVAGQSTDQSEVAVASKAPRFEWHWREARELSSERTIKRSRGLRRVERTALTRAIAARLRPAMADLQIDSESELLRVAASTRVEFVDVNEDGVPEVIAQANDWKAGCGATGNCPLWVLQKREGAYKVLLDTRGGVQLFAVESNKTDGFFDVVVSTSESGDGRDLFLYRYRNGTYRLNSCYNADWWSSKGGAWHKLKQPAVTPLSCPH